MTLKEFKKKEKALWQNVQEWIREGWQTDINITPLLAAEALLREASTQDQCIVINESDRAYPTHLRKLAMDLILETIKENIK